MAALFQQFQSHRPDQESTDRLGVYRRLDPTRKEIRVLHVKRATGRHLVSCKLKYVSLLERPKYEAISWCWGDASKKKSIYLDGHVVNIAEGAEQVLRRLCSDQGHLIVWIDAVCINQSDIAERGHQVAMMKDVYSQAERVLVWLGGGRHRHRIGHEIH